VFSTWLDTSSLPTKPLNKIIKRVDGVSVSSIVEGSDVEVEGEKFTEPFTVEEFWAAVEAVDKEADFYWQRDNSRWFFIEGLHTANLKETWGELTWTEDEGDEIPEEDKQMIEEFLSMNYFQYDAPAYIGGYSITQWENNSTY